MKNPLNWLKGAALVALTVFCIVLTFTVWGINTRSAVTLAKLNNDLDEAHRLLLEAGLTAREARLASTKEVSYLDSWNSQISQTVSDFQDVLLETRSTLATVQATSQAATGAIQTTQATVQALQEPIRQAGVTLQAAQHTTEALQPVISHLDALVTDPAIPATLANVQSTTGHIDGTTAEVQKAVHKYLFPTWPERILGYVKTGVVTASQIIF